MYTHFARLFLVIAALIPFGACKDRNRGNASQVKVDHQIAQDGLVVANGDQSKNMWQILPNVQFFESAWFESRPDTSGRQTYNGEFLFNNSARSALVGGEVADWISLLGTLGVQPDIQGTSESYRIRQISCQAPDSIGVGDYSMTFVVSSGSAPGQSIKLTDEKAKLICSRTPEIRFFESARFEHRGATTGAPTFNGEFAFNDFARVSQVGDSVTKWIELLKTAEVPSQTASTGESWHISQLRCSRTRVGNAPNPTCIFVPSAVASGGSPTLVTGLGASEMWNNLPEVRYFGSAWFERRVGSRNPETYNGEFLYTQTQRATSHHVPEWIGFLKSLGVAPARMGAQDEVSFRTGALMCSRMASEPRETRCLIKAGAPSN